MSSHCKKRRIVLYVSIACMLQAMVIITVGIPNKRNNPTYINTTTNTEFLPTYESSSSNSSWTTPIWLPIALNITPDSVRYYDGVRTRCEVEAKWQRHAGMNLCPCIPRGIPGQLPSIDIDYLLNISWRDAEKLASSGVLPGGHHKPSQCTSRRRVSIIVPYRDRESHLRAFLVHHHPIWQQQMIEYRVFVVEQNMPHLFNKAAMMNIGFLEARKVFPADCVLFHDVDTLVETNGNMLICMNQPVHLAPFIDKYNYLLPYASAFGAAVLMTIDNFIEVNGYSNSYFGWGGEDDDMSSRLRAGKHKIYRGPKEIAKYRVIPHTRDTANPPSPDGYRGFRIRRSAFETDGIGSHNLKYKLLESVNNVLYTWIHVDLTEPRPPASTHNEYLVLKAACESNDTQDTHWDHTSHHNDTNPEQRFHVSRTSCSGLCDGIHGCVAFSYHPSNVTDSYCRLHHVDACSNIVACRTMELHVQKPHYSRLYYT